MSAPNARTLRQAALLRPAKTVLRLYGQLMRADQYSEGDLHLIRRAYDQGVKRFSFRFQSTGAPFESHCVGVASMLATLELPATLIAAGLVHNVYFWGDFADGTEHGATPARRTRVRAALGEVVEDYLHGLPRFRHALRTGGMETLVADVESLDERRRHLLLLATADRLDHHLDGPYRTLDAAVRARWEEQGPVFAEAVQRLGYPALATALTETCRIADGDVPAELLVEHPRAFLVVPHSCRERRVVTLRKEFRRRTARMTRSRTDLQARLGRRVGTLMKRSRRGT